MSRWADLLDETKAGRAYLRYSEAKARLLLILAGLVVALLVVSLFTGSIHT